jgi:hypothetical protein
MAAAFGAAAVITLRGGIALTGSLVLALAAVLIEVLIFPRTYSYPKLVIYAAGAWAVVRYADRPSPTRVVLLAVLVVGAFLMRHDHGLYVGIAAMAAVVLSPVPSDRRRGMSSAALLCGAGIAYALPYLIYLQMTGGVLTHIQRALAFTALEVPRRSTRDCLTPWCRRRCSWCGSSDRGGVLFPCRCRSSRVSQVSQCWWSPSAAHQ